MAELYTSEDEGRRAAEDDAITKEEFCARFKARMLAIAGPTFADGESIAEYADETAPTYWDDPGLRECGPEECASEDVSCWESE